MNKDKRRYLIWEEDGEITQALFSFFKKENDFSDSHVKEIEKLKIGRAYQVDQGSIIITRVK